MVQSVIAAVVAACIPTLSILASISSTNQAFGQFTPTFLSLSTFPNNGKVGSAGTLRVSLSGKLTSEIPEVSQGGKIPTSVQLPGATILITGTGDGKEYTVTTDEFGNYKTDVDLGPGTHEIQAYFPGDATHKGMTAGRLVTVTP